MLEHLRTLFVRDIDALRVEVGLYPDDGLLWREVPGCPNSGGNLALHLVGNLRHFIGAQLGGTGYVRDRDAEFAARGISRAQLQAGIEQASAEVARTLLALDPARLKEPFFLPPNVKPIETGLWLLQTSCHLAYHLGQIDYHRRTVTGDRTPSGALSAKPLFGT